MKYTVHAKTGDYEFIEAEIEGTAEEAVALYEDLKRASKVGPGLDTKAWNALVDSYLATGQIEGDPGQLEGLNAAQKWFVQEVKKSLKRTNK